MSDQAETRAKNPVTELIIEPLQADGMIRPKGMTAGAFEGFLRTLREELRYMSGAGLKVLRYAIAENAGGKTRNEWPRILLIVNMANAIQKKPPEFSRLVTSYMKSAAGREAWGISPIRAYALAKYLHDVKRPPDEGGWRVIDRWQQGRVERLELTQRRVTNGASTPRDHEFLDSHDQVIERTRALVFPEPQEGSDVA